MSSPRLNILVACEYSGRVREAFRKLGHNAWSADLLPAEDASPYHRQGDWRGLANGLLHWDLCIAFPPCTHLCSSGARWWKDKVIQQKEAIIFFMEFTKLTCPWAIENPIGKMSKVYRQPDQIIQPWMFGHGETKGTCLWLHGLSKLVPTGIVVGREARVHRMSPSPDRWRERSRTLQGIADAMASQWSAHLLATRQPSP